VQETPYQTLASAYDVIMQDVPYDQWWVFVRAQLSRRGGLPTEQARVLELGCGTGNATQWLLRECWRVTAIDASPRMLAVAREKGLAADLVEGDLRTAAFEPDAYALTLAMYDVINHLLEPDALSNLARRVLAALKPGGWWVFDVNTPAGLRDPWLGEPLEGVADGVHFRIDHSWDEASAVATLDAWWRDGVRVHQERHWQRAYEPGAVAATLQKVGFASVAALSETSGEAADDTEPRVWVFAQRPLVADGAEPNAV